MKQHQSFHNLSQCGQLNYLFNGFAKKRIYTKEQLAELHLQTTALLFHLEQSLPQEAAIRYQLCCLRWTLNIDPLNSALHYEACLQLMQWLLEQPVIVDALT